jgi:hypothetical protein
MRLNLKKMSLEREEVKTRAVGDARGPEVRQGVLRGRKIFALDDADRLR